MLEHLRTPEAQRQMVDILNWLRVDENRILIRNNLEELPTGTQFFRLTRAVDEEAAQKILDFRPTFFATTEEEANKYLGFANRIPTGRLLMMRATTLKPIRSASADQFAITSAIYLGSGNGANRLSSLSYLYPPHDNLPEGLSDTITIRIQRWIVPIVVSRFLEHKFRALKRTGVDEININKPLYSMDIEFDWLE
ncbi:iron-chelator utilization protein [Methylobacterium sp. ME121]|jgi:hypothetical protein|nr:iron-chelator utilization protein [Methylobacterium sp. ME121]